jgi:hypothetical protein
MPAQGVADTNVTLRSSGLTEVNVRMERYADASSGVAARAEKEGSSVILAGGKRRLRGHGSYVCGVAGACSRALRPDAGISAPRARERQLQRARAEALQDPGPPFHPLSEVWRVGSRTRAAVWANVAASRCWLLVGSYSYIYLFHVVTRVQ